MKKYFFVSMVICCLMACKKVTQALKDQQGRQVPEADRYCGNANVKQFTYGAQNLASTFLLNCR